MGKSPFDGSLKSSLRRWLFHFFLKPKVLLRQVSIFLDETSMVVLANLGYPSIYGRKLHRLLVNITSCLFQPFSNMMKMYCSIVEWVYAGRQRIAEMSETSSLNNINDWNQQFNPPYQKETPAVKG